MPAVCQRRAGSVRSRHLRHFDRARHMSRGCDKRQYSPHFSARIMAVMITSHKAFLYRCLKGMLLSLLSLSLHMWRLIDPTSSNTGAPNITFSIITSKCDLQDQTSSLLKRISGWIQTRLSANPTPHQPGNYMENNMLQGLYTLHPAVGTISESSRMRNRGAEGAGVPLKNNKTNPPQN
jgi:hypothetical protein